MLNFYGIKFTFENLFITTCIILASIIIINLIFWITLFIIKLRRKKLKLKYTNRENGHKLNRFKFIDTEIDLESKKKGFFKINSFNLLLKKETYFNFFKSLIKKETYTFFKNPKFWIISLTIFSGILIYQSMNLMFNGFPDVINRYPLEEEIWADPNKPVMVEFDRPIDIEKLKFSLVPEIEGNLEFEKSFANLPFTRKVYFYPKASTDSGFTFYNYVSGIHALWNNEQRYDHETYFLSYRSPEIQEVSVKDKDTDILVNAPIILNLNKNYDNFTDFDFEFNPIIEFDKVIEGNKITIQPKSTLAQSANYKFSIFRTLKVINLENNEEISKNAKELIQEINFTTVKAPQIKSFSPIGNAVFVDSEIKIEFSKEMFPETVLEKLSVSPTFAFTPEWNTNNSILVLKKSSNLDFGKEYEIKLLKGAKGKGDTILESDFSYKFTTIGEVKILSTSPGNGAGSVNIQTQIQINFNQEVDKNSAQSKFSISPNIGTSFSWNGNSLIIKPNGSFAYGTQYTYGFANGIISIKGQNSPKSFSYNFTTRAQTISLNVPLYRQSPYSFACNVTAASMIMTFKGKSATNVQIYNSLPKSGPTNYDSANNIWGDPDAGFVGPLQSNGYGVHWTPISNYLSSQGVNNQVRRGMTASQLAKELESGKPAIIWWWNQINKGSNGGPISQSWTTPSGKTVNTIIGMHSEVVIGFNGSTENPTSFIVNDPRGSKRTVPVGTFNYLWGIFGNTAIIVN